MLPDETSSHECSFSCGNIILLHNQLAFKFVDEITIHRPLALELVQHVHRYTSQLSEVASCTAIPTLNYFPL